MDVTFIGERITELRLKKGVSEYVRTITSGQALPSVNELFNIFEYFEMTPAQFFDESYPQMIHQAVEYMKKLDDEDMLLLLNIIQSLCQRLQKEP